MNINIISRGKGKSAVAAAAYRAGESIKNEYDGQVHDYTSKKGIVHAEILLPENASVEYLNRSELWNAVEKIEKAKNAQLSREVRLALPNVFSLEQNINLVHEYVRQNFVDKGMCADICIHDRGDGNPHAHVMLTMRPFEKGGTWGAKSKMEYILDDNGERIKLPSGRPKTKKISVTGWDEQGNAEIWRKSWADILNDNFEKYGHEIIVDHRSYARQGLEVLPTIHLGVVAHGLEQRGIDTERGDINRSIRAANARLKSVDNEINAIKNPPKPQLIIDLEKSIKAQNSPGYAHWARIFNLQQMAHTLIYIQENGFVDMESMQTAHQNAKTDVADIQQQIDSTKAKSKSLVVQKEQAEIYRKTLETYKKYNASGQFAYFKNKFYDQHKVDIDAHKKARAYLFEELKLDKFPSLKKLSGEIGELTAQEKSLRQELKAKQSDVYNLSTITHNARMLLGYNELEMQGNIPTIPSGNLRFMLSYHDTLTHAQKRGETKEYFQSLSLDIDCADFIRRGIEKGMDTTSLIKETLTTYGKHRAAKVVAAFANNASSGKYSDFEKIDPITTTHQAFQFTPSDFFMQKFEEIAGSMQSIIFKYDDKGVPLTDENGQTTQHFGWAFPKEAAQQKLWAGKKDWDVGLSIADRMAMAKQKVDEQERSQPSRIKPKRSNDHEL